MLENFPDATATHLHPADRQEQAWLLRERATPGSRSQATEKQITMESPSPETAWDSDSEETGWWVASSSLGHPGGDVGAPWHAATGPLLDKIALQDLPDDAWVPVMQFSF